jgi:hypothetical protein
MREKCVKFESTPKYFVDFFEGVSLDQHAGGRAALEIEVPQHNLVVLRPLAHAKCLYPYFLTTGQ